MAWPFLNSGARRIDQLVSVDLGNLQSKAVHLQQRGDRLVLGGFVVQPAPKQEKDASLEAFTSHVKGLVHALGDPTRNVVFSLGVAEAFVRHAELPPMPLPEMRQMLRLNSKAYLQQDYADHVFDCSIVLLRAPAPSASGEKRPMPQSAGPQKQKILVGGARRQRVEDLKNACRNAGLVACQILPGMVGPLNAFEAAEPEVFAKEVVALVDLGCRHTVISMLDKGELAMNRVVQIGGEQVTAALAEAMGIVPAEAEGIKVGMASEVQPHLEMALSNLGRELRASIDFFENHHDMRVGQVFLSGSAARNEIMARILQNELTLPCKAWNPTAKLQLALPAEQRARLEEVAPELSVAVGAAVAAL
jgi:type IV pilus assembly protein PilM